MFIKNKYLILYALILTALTMHTELFAPLGGSSIATGDSPSSIHTYAYGPSRLSGTVDHQYGPSKMSSRIPCKQTCAYYGPGPCTQKDWDRLK